MCKGPPDHAMAVEFSVLQWHDGFKSSMNFHNFHYDDDVYYCYLLSVIVLLIVIVLLVAVYSLICIVSNQK